uniref:Disease resistance protein At4g27190-like leucine-rich repeats domain-containing protein n=2 Tax=Aegilops tauschii subsp. strangulata TaxID=200361 RepID=A0A453MHX4_AEGTS
MAAAPPEPTLKGRTLVVKDFDDAVKQLIDFLHHGDDAAEGRIKAFLFHGWFGQGLGASAVLRATAEHLKSKRSNPDMKLQFGKVVHVDCSLWKNRRTMQREIAAELNLGHLMPIFDKQDEDDDFRGVEDSSRAELISIASEIYESLINEKFLLILHYGGDADIDLAELGVPVFGPFGKAKLLWTNHGRFQLSQKQQKLLTSSFLDINMLFITSDHIYIGQQLRCLLHKEAVEVISYTGMDDINPATVVDCFLYSLLLVGQLRENSDTVEYDWATYVCNYWICDGILQKDRAWEVGNALYGVIGQLRHSSDAIETLLYWLDQQIKSYQGWKSIASNQQGAQSISAVPVDASSYFLTFKGDDLLELPNDLFQLANNLRVLKLCKCSFDFAFPPFQSCHNLRFLWLDHCANTGKDQGGGACFPNLIVLELSHTDYALQQQMIERMTNLREINTKGVSWRNISHAWKTLQNVHKLRLTESSDVITVDNCSSLDMINPELLDLSGNTCMESLPRMSSAASLKMLVLDGCSNLETVALEGALPLLETFSFDGYGPTENWAHPINLPQKEFRPKSRATPIKEAKVTKISLVGCGRLHSIFLRGLANLDELDLSDTSIKILDLGAMDVPELRKLLLRGCRQLCSLGWRDYNPSRLEVVHVDTMGRKRLVVCCAQAREDFFSSVACITLTDARILWRCMRELFWFIYGRGKKKLHLHISSTVHSQIAMTKSVEEIGPSKVGFVPTGRSLPYKDIILLKDVACSSLVCDQRQLQPLDVHMEIGDEGHNLESMDTDIYFRRFTLDGVQSLHVHDNSSITAIPPRGPQTWHRLRWCHVDRCPKLYSLFYCEAGEFNFINLRTFSAFDLPTACCIWGKTNPKDPEDCIYLLSAFTALHSIYLHNCPKLVFVLPISFTLPSLETIQIAYCSNLQYVFPLDNEYPPEIASGVTFQNLKHIKLYHLHRLEQICETRLTAPALETISLRDCWGLRRIPAVVARQGPKLVVDCEKDWWGKLEWDGLQAGHDPSLFETRHSAYYKKTLPRVSVLRCDLLHPSAMSSLVYKMQSREVRLRVSVLQVWCVHEQVTYAAMHKQE